MYCRICKSRAVKRYKRVDGVIIYRCRLCNHAFVDPKTPRKNTSDIYSFSHYQERENQFRKRYSTTVDLIKKYAKGKRVLEVGAGFGLLGSMLIKKGFEMDVLEPTVYPYYLERTKARIHKKTLAQYGKETKSKFDVIIMYDVLEHFTSPQSAVLLAQKLLKVDGIILIQTPNYQSIMARTVRNWSWWMIEDHRHFFSQKSLNILFDAKKWRREFYTSYEEWIDFKKNLDGNFKSKIQKVLFLSWFVTFYLMLRNVFWKLGYGGLHVSLYRLI